MGLDIYLRWTGQTEAEQKAQYTGFATTGSVGYLRSAYNDGGFNNWARRILGGKDYYWIFAYKQDEEKPTGEPIEGEGEDTYEPTGFFPDWDACRERCLEAIEAAKQLDNLYTVAVDGFMIKPLVEGLGQSGLGAPDLEPDQALQRYRETTALHKDSAVGDWTAFSNKDGLFNLGPPFRVKALIWTQLYGILRAVLICEGDEADDPHKYYRESLEECLTFIDMGKQKNGWLSWSG